MKAGRLLEEIIRGHFLVKRPISWLSLPLIVLFQEFISLMTLHNTVFQDEALYLVAGRQIVNSWVGLPYTPVPWGTFISGYPYLYPIIGGVLGMLGGLELARLFSLLCMMGVTVCVYYVTRHLFDQNSAILAAALFAFQGTVLFLGRLATYDALCLVLLALALALAVHVSIARKPWAAIGIGPLLVLAILAKYAGLLFAPIPLVILILRSLERQGWYKMFLRMGLALASVAVTSVVTYLNFDKESWQSISETTTNRDVFIQSAPPVLIQHIITLGGVAFALGVLGLVLSNWRRLPIGELVLFGSSLLAPVYHIYKGELISLHKHIAFSMFFIMPLAGYAVARISSYRPNLSLGRYWLTGLAICLIITFSLGVRQAQSLYGEWPPSNKLMDALRTQVRLAPGRYLAEDTDICRYSLQDVTELWQWSNLDFFAYTDKEHHYLVDNDAYRAAIDEGYFDLVELSFGYDAATAVFIDQELRASQKYTLIAKIPYSNTFGTGYYWIWRRVYLIGNNIAKDRSI